MVNKDCHFPIFRSVPFTFWHRCVRRREGHGSKFSPYN